MRGLVPRGVRFRMLLRSFAVQGSWNYATLIGTGFAFTLLPALHRLYGGDEEALEAAVRRHAELFNTHPYLAPLAVGAVVRLESEAVDPGTTERFKGALRGSLGSLGDQLVWWAWRPMSSLLAVCLCLAGGAWWFVVGAFLVLYNTVHLGLRVWGFGLGLRLGLAVGKAVRDAPFQLIRRRAADTGAVLGGFALVLALAPHAGDRAEIGILLAATAVGLRFGTEVRRLAWVALALVWAASIVFGIMGERVL